MTDNISDEQFGDTLAAAKDECEAGQMVDLEGKAAWLEDARSRIKSPTAQAARDRSSRVRARRQNFSRRSCGHPQKPEQPPRIPRTIPICLPSSAEQTAAGQTGISSSALQKQP